MKRTAFIQITTTTDSRKNADQITDTLLDRKIAACVQVVGPLDSRYWWKGKREKAREWLLVIKTTSKNYRKAETAIRSVHPFETPEIVATPLISGLAAYLGWIRDTVE